MQQRFPDLNRDSLRQQIGAIGDSPAVARDKLDAWREQRDVERSRFPERRQNLQDRLTDFDRDEWQSRRDEIRNDRQENRDQRREDWQQHRNNAREDWQNWFDDRYYYHYSWHHGCWHNGWYGYWDHMWDEHPVAVAFGLTCWGINTMGYMYGTMAYSNPYYVGPVTGTAVDYSQPQITVQQIVTSDTASDSAGIPDEGLQVFEQARSAFYSGAYDDALRLTGEALQHMPHDAVVQEFRALILFASQRYSEAAAVLHSVLAVGPGWDWTTMSQLYPGIDVYSNQLKALENWTKENPALPDGHFVLAYHYMTCGHHDEAVEQLRLVSKALPEDTVSLRLLNLLTGEAPAPNATSTEQATEKSGDREALTTEQLQGEWRASAGNASFILKLQEDGRFEWTFSNQGQSQTVAGVFAIDKSTLAMEPDAGGIMLAELRLDGTKLSFQQVGAEPAGDALLFTRQ